jgi:hypothetical protein
MATYGGPDYSSQPLLPAWYTIGWTSQDPDYVVAPLNPYTELPFPTDQVFVTVTAMYFDGNGNALGGYLEFQQSDDMTITEGGVSYRVPARNTGLVPPGAWYGYSYRGSSRLYLFQGQLNVNLMATNNPNVVTDTGNALVYHVKEYFFGGRNFDITVPMTDTTADISTLIVAGTITPNLEWNLGY